MSVLEAELSGGREWSRVGDCFEVTKKPHGINRSAYSEIPFAAMEAIPQGGGYAAKYAMKVPRAIASGTYFEKGDILVAKITPSFENGKQALASDLPATFGYATTEVIPLHPRDPKCDPRLLFFYLLHPDVRHYVAERMEGSTGRQRIPEGVLLDLPFPSFSADEQPAMGDALEALQHARALEIRAEKGAKQLKYATLQALFRRGLRCEAHKETAIGLLPHSWAAERLDRHATVISTRMSYSEFEQMDAVESDGAVKVLGIKVADMNAAGNETVLNTAAIEKFVLIDQARRRCAPAGTIVFPKRGAAIATNKKRITNKWTVFDPNVIGVVAGADVDKEFLFYWFQMFDLRTITEPGPTPQLNKKNLDPLIIPVPPTIAEQKEIVSILEALDHKIDLHRKKRSVLEDLFRALLHKLITGEIRASDLDLGALEPKQAVEVNA